MTTPLTALIAVVTVGFLPAVIRADNSIYGQPLDAPGPGYRQQVVQHTIPTSNTTYFHSVVPQSLPAPDQLTNMGMDGAVSNQAVILPLKLNLIGIGARILTVHGKCTIMEVLKGSGAEAAGLKKSDVITQIDSKNIESLQLLEVVPLIRGEPGTTVLLTIQRTGEIKPLIVTVTRHIVKFPPPEEQ